MLPDWLFWLIIWWAAWFAAFLSWYAGMKREPPPAIVLFFIAVFAGIMPPLIIIGLVIKRLRGDN